MSEYSTCFYGGLPGFVRLLYYVTDKSIVKDDIYCCCCCCNGVVVCITKLYVRAPVLSGAYVYMLRVHTKCKVSFKLSYLEMRSRHYFRHPKQSLHFYSTYIS